MNTGAIVCQYFVIANLCESIPASLTVISVTNCNRCTGDGSIVCDATDECSVTTVISVVILIALVCKYPFLIVLGVVSGQACCCGYVINRE